MVRYSTSPLLPKVDPTQPAAADLWALQWVEARIPTNITWTLAGRGAPDGSDILCYLSGGPPKHWVPAIH